MDLKYNKIKMKNKTHSEAGYIKLRIKNFFLLKYRKWIIYTFKITKEDNHYLKEILIFKTLWWKFLRKCQNSPLVLLKKEKNQ